MIEKLYKIFCANPKISTDSRTTEEGSIFFALSGENFNGNKFAQAALEKGAVCAVIDDENYASNDRCLLVDNTLETLWVLATHHREQLDIPFIAISGSNGKTTTKELLGAVLMKKFKVNMTRGNLNNHIGVPLTLLSITSHDQIAIVEMGASHVGEIELLCNIAKPNYGLLTNVGRAHLEGFGGVEGVIKAKGELFDYLWKHEGTAFYRVEDSVIRSMIELREGLLTQGFSAEDITLKNNLVGDYNRYNIAAAVAVGSYFGVEGQDITSAIEHYEPTNNRSQLTKTELNTLIVDCYNANPSSMESALDNFLSEAFDCKIAILGDMFELGEFSKEEHLKVLKKLEAVGVTRAIVVGNNFAEVAKDYSPTNYSLTSYLSCEDFIAHEKMSGALILLKGSRGIGLESLIKHL